jgi:hypothetical protein
MLVILGFMALSIGTIEGSFFLESLPYQVHTTGIMLAGALLIFAGVVDAKK